jgi:hypothetical protein
MAAVPRLEEFIVERWAALGELDHRARDFEPPPANPPLDEDEADGFMRGIDAGLFAVGPRVTKAGVTEMGYLSDLCDISQDFFADGARTGRRTFSRESVSQWAAASDLITKFGWDESCVFDRVRRFVFT